MQTKSHESARVKGIVFVCIACCCVLCCKRVSEDPLTHKWEMITEEPAENAMILQQAEGSQCVWKMGQDATTHRIIIQPTAHLAARGRSPSCVRARLQSCRQRVKMNRPLGPGARAGWSQHSPFQPDRFPQGLKPAIHWTASTARLKSCPDTLPVSMRLSPRAARTSKLDGMNPWGVDGFQGMPTPRSRTFADSACLMR